MKVKNSNFKLNSKSQSYRSITVKLKISLTIKKKLNSLPINSNQKKLLSIITIGLMKFSIKAKVLKFTRKQLTMIVQVELIQYSKLRLKL